MSQKRMTAIGDHTQNLAMAFSVAKAMGLFLILAILSSRTLAQPLPTSTPEAEGFDVKRLGCMHALVQEYVTAGKHAGAVSLVVRHGKIVDWRAYGYRDLEAKLPMERNTIMRVYSMTKVITGVAVLQLFEQGRFRLSDPVANWIPELANPMVCIGGTPDSPRLEPARTGITIKMLMNHTAGLTYDDDYSSKLVGEIYERANLWNSSSLDEFVGKLSQMPLVSQPGTEFNYSVGFDVLGLLIERISGETFDTYCRKHIFEPLGMKDTGFDVPPEKMDRVATLYTRDPNGTLCESEVPHGAYAEENRGIVGGGGGAFSTIADYARFAQMLLNGGQLEGVRILGRKTVEFALANSLSHLPRVTYSWSECEGWGLFCAVRIDLGKGDDLGSVGAFSWNGFATTDFLADPQEQLLMLLFAQYVPEDEPFYMKFRNTVYQALSN